MRMQPIGQGTPLGIPYYRPNDPDSHDFIDLKAELHRIAEVPELRAEPELEKVVRLLNDADSPFKSTGCNRWYDERPIAEGNVNYGSYIGFALDAWPFAAQEASLATIERFGRFLEQQPLHEKTFGRFEIRATSWNREARVGWSLEFWTWGFGADRVSAREAWVPGVRLFGEFLVSEKAAWNAFLAEHRHPPNEESNLPTSAV